MKNNFKGKLNISLLVKCAVALVFPLVVCLVYCAVRRVGINELFLPASYNNDCLFYYKQIEAILTGGTPYGYFGFNESHAAVGGLAAWSPLIYFPWIAWGRIFGWNFASVLVCNVVLFGIALCVFTALTKPGTLQFVLSLLTLALFPSFPIHLFNALPEAVVASVFIVFIGLSLRSCELASIKVKSTQNKETVKDRTLIAMTAGAFVTGAYLTVIRPYMIVFLAVPIYVLIRSYGKKMIVVSAAGVIATVLAYVLITKCFTADYFSPLFDISTVKMLLQGRIEEAFWSTIYVVKDMSAGIGKFIASAFSFGSTAGTQYVMALLGMALSAVLFFGKKSEEKKNTDRKPFYLVYFISLVLLFGAIVLFLQKSNEGARHLWIFAITGCLLMPETTSAKITNGYRHILYLCVKIVSLILLCVFLVRGSLVPTDYDIPIGTPELRDNIDEWIEAFNSIEVDKETEDGYENTVDWVIMDYSDEDYFVTEYAPLYVLPEGMGISCCYPDLFFDENNSVKSRYIYTDARGNVAALCEQKGMTVVAKVGNTVVFERAYE